MCEEECGESLGRSRSNARDLERLLELDEVRSDEIKAGVKKEENRKHGAPPPSPHVGDGLVVEVKTNTSIFKRTLEDERDFKVPQQ